MAALAEHSDAVSAELLTSSACFLLDRATPLTFGQDAIDICGTGGDKANVKTFNISTAAAFVLAACGAKVVKHGNRAVSGTSGSSDVLSSLGVALSQQTEEASASYINHGLCFLAAPAFHPALKTLAAVRKSFGRPSFINLLGPLCNPARTTRQIIGVYDRAYMLPMAETAKALGKEYVVFLHADCGIDEIAPAGVTYTTTLKDGKISEGILTPADFGLPEYDLSSLAIASPADSAAMIVAAFNDEHAEAAQVIALNAALGLVVSGIENDLKTASLHAQKTIKNGLAKQKLMEMRV